MKEPDAIFQLDAHTLRVAGVGLWTYDTVARKLWYSGFADNIHVGSGPLCVDIDTYLSIVADADKAKVVAYMLSMHTPHPDSGLQYMIHGDGQDFYLDNRVVSSTPQAGGFMVRGYVQDITRQVRLEHELADALSQAQHSELLKSAFIANISHEFRTPITAIIGFSSFIMQDCTPAEKQEYFAIIEENSTRLLRLINSLIYLSELQVGTYVFNYQSFNLSYLIDRLIADYQPQCASSVELINKTRRAKYATEVVSDENAVSVVFSHLLKNALKCTSAGEVSLGYSEDKEGCVTCFVSDTGVGITAEQQKQLFETFYKRNMFDDGVGLGLPLCQLIIQELGGRIWAESEPKVGSTIYFTLPQQAAPQK